MLENNNHYVMLTGGRNNSGDYLIKHKAKELLSSHRPDRELVDLNGWESIDTKRLNLINSGKALLLTGGPALQKNMVPNVYALDEVLDDISVPIVSFGIGWHSLNGEWENTRKYKLSKKTTKILSRLCEHPMLNSVRDYYTLGVMRNNGVKNTVATGCPAMYDYSFLKSGGGNQRGTENVTKIAISLGVALKNSQLMENQAKNLVEGIAATFSGAEIVVAFHHGITEDYMGSVGADRKLYSKNTKFASWLESCGISYRDVSGSAESLISFYDSCDVHVGYRVHAHIYCSSTGKPSLLISEDGRGTSINDFLGGVKFKAFDSVNEGLFIKALNKLGVGVNAYSAVETLGLEVADALKRELSGGVRLKKPFESICDHYSVMNNFIKQLP